VPAVAARPETRQLPIIMLTARARKASVSGSCDRRRLHRQAVLGAELLARCGLFAAQSRAPRTVLHYAISNSIARNAALPLGPSGRSRPDRISPAGVFPGTSGARVPPASNCSTASGAAISNHESHRRLHIGAAQIAESRPQQDPIRTVRGAGYALDDRFCEVE